MSTPRRTPQPHGLAVALVTLCVAAASCAEGTVEGLVAEYGPDPTPSSLPLPSADDDTGRSPSRSRGTVPSITPGEVVSAVATDCPFPTAGLGEVECGEVTVPGRGTAADDITLVYARFLAFGSSDDRRADPVVYLHGGPGGEVVEFADLFTYAVVDPFILQRDVIVYDQRGGGLSSPLPPCSQAWEIEPDYYSKATPHDEISERYMSAISRCGRSLGLNTDIDLSTYNSAVHADDLVDLMAALGVETFNVYGSSYGSRLAQTVMRDHPEAVRSVIMSGVYPIEENLLGSTPETYRIALDTIFDACAAIPQCDEALPDPWATLQGQVDRLDEEPVLTTLAVDSTTEFDLVIAGDDLINSLHAALYRWDAAAMIADLLIDLDDGDTSRLVRLARDSVADISAVAPYLTVQCREEVPFTSIEEIDALHTGIDSVDRIDLPPGLLGSELIEVCDSWAVLPIDWTENDPVTWDEPTLLFSGGFDPITPASWAASMAARLPNAHLVHSNDLGHDSDESVCTQRIMRDFIDDPDAALTIACAGANAHPTLDGAAVRWRPETTAELTTSTVDLGGRDGRPFEIDTPDWLSDRGDGTRVWWRDLDTLDLTALVIQPGSASPESLSGYLDVDDVASELESDTSRVAGWTRRELTTAGMDAIVYERSEPYAISVALTAYDDEITELDRRVLVPMLESVAFG